VAVENPLILSDLGISPRIICGHGPSHLAWQGRAGRTAEGHCIRLFHDEDLTRENIEPEIQRSSLDLVVLQLASLNFDPVGKVSLTQLFFPMRHQVIEKASSVVVAP
jgi:hypothetical protein